MARVAIIKPPLVVPTDHVASQSGIPPIGVAYLAGSLKAAGHEVQVIDAHGEDLDRHTRLRDPSILLVNGLTIPDILARLWDDVDVFAISCMFSNEWIYAKRIIRAIARRYPGVPIIAGGEHVTAEASRVLRDLPEVNACGLGEGEDTIVELVDALVSGMSLSTISGLAYLDDGQLVVTPPRGRIRSPDDIAAPCWDDIPVHRYLDAGLALGEYNRRAMPILATRGCPFECTFCSNPRMWEPRWYARSPAKVVEEIQGYVERFGIDHVDFCDLTAILNKKWTIEFCQHFIAAGLKVSLALPVGTRSEALTDEVLGWLSRAGVTRVQYAPESGSPTTLKRIKKRVDLDKMTKSMEGCVRYGMMTKATLIYGFPGQTLGEAMESVQFMLKLAVMGVDDVACFRFAPYPGSELYDQLNESGVLDTERMSEDEYDLFLAANLYNKAGGMRSYSEHIPSWMMPGLTIGGMALFYSVQFGLRPKRLVRAARNLTRGTPLSMFETTVHGLFRNFAEGRRGRNVHFEPNSSARAECSLEGL